MPHPLDVLFGHARSPPLAEGSEHGLASLNRYRDGHGYSTTPIA
jgi:hypothetical protein